MHLDEVTGLAKRGPAAGSKKENSACSVYLMLFDSGGFFNAEKQCLYGLGPDQMNTI